jgi:hypothetical protein
VEAKWEVGRDLRSSAESVRLRRILVAEPGNPFRFCKWEGFSRLEEPQIPPPGLKSSVGMTVVSGCGSFAAHFLLVAHFFTSAAAAGAGWLLVAAAVCAPPAALSFFS